MGGTTANFIVHLVTPGWSPKETRLEPKIAEPSYVKSMIQAGENPKPMVLEECKPQCQMWKDKLTRCEGALEAIIKVNPTKTCLYPMRDYVTCVEACAQPLIHNNLVGTH